MCCENELVHFDWCELNFVCEAAQHWLSLPLWLPCDDERRKEREIFSESCLEKSTLRKKQVKKSRAGPRWVGLVKSSTISHCSVFKLHALPPPPWPFSWGKRASFRRKKHWKYITCSSAGSDFVGPVNSVESVRFSWCPVFSVLMMDVHVWSVPGVWQTGLGSGWLDRPPCEHQRAL